MNKLIQMLRKSEIYFIFCLILFNLYCAFNTGDVNNTLNGTNLTLAAVMLMMATDKLFPDKNN